MSSAEPVRMKGNVLINCGMWHGDAIYRIRRLEDQGTGTAPRRNVSRVRTERDTRQRRGSAWSREEPCLPLCSSCLGTIVFSRSGRTGAACSDRCSSSRGTPARVAGTPPHHTWPHTRACWRGLLTTSAVSIASSPRAMPSAPDASGTQDWRALLWMIADSPSPAQQHGGRVSHLWVGVVVGQVRQELPNPSVIRGMATQFPDGTEARGQIRLAHGGLD